uniref:Complex 1 LYR protein domain-containing protein n=1 Tax=Aegilops tauschii TaxID=37682 RepID=M8BC64_AEGTA
MASRTKLSGIQRQALALYRGFLRTARLKSPEERRRIESVVSAEFRENAKSVDRRNFVYIEYLMRRGKRQLDQLKNPDITGLSTLEINKEMLKDPIPISFTLHSYSFYHMFLFVCIKASSIPEQRVEHDLGVSTGRQ